MAIRTRAPRNERTMALTLAALLAMVGIAMAALPDSADAARPRWDGGIDLYRPGVFATQKTWHWCTAADVQIMRNVVHHTTDHSSAQQRRFFTYMRAHNRYPIPVKHGVDPRGVYENHLEELFALMDEGTGKRPPIKMVAYEPFGFAGRLSGGGSGSGWAGQWTATIGSGASTTSTGLRYPDGTDLFAVGGSLLERSGGVASQRMLAEPISLAGGYFYLSFLAQKDESGRFRIETSNGEHIRLGLEVTADGAVTAQGGTVKTSSTSGLFRANTCLLYTSDAADDFAVV